LKECTNPFDTNIRLFFFVFKTVRGFGANYILCDEANFMKKATFLEAIFPVVQEDFTVFIGLTTPKGDNNEVTRLFNTKDKDGEPIISAIRIGRPCEECRQKKILCVHAENAVPAGVSRKKRSRYQAFYQGGDEHKAMREYQGEAGDDNVTIFQQSWLEKMAARRSMPVKTPLDFILLSVDPAAGGRCEWGVCACYYDIVDPGTQVIIQLDACRLDHLDPYAIKTWLKTTIDFIRSSHHVFRMVPIVIACEAAPKNITLNMQGYLRELIEQRHVFDVHMLKELGEKEEAGVPKTNRNTRHMVHYTQNLLATGRVAFSEAFRTSTFERSSDEIIKEFFSQLASVKIRREQKPNGEWLVKIDGKGGGRNDDLAVAYIMNFYWYISFMISSKLEYRNIKNRSEQWRRGRYVKMDEPVLGMGEAARNKREEEDRKRRRVLEQSIM
jgi:hypothetical protein